MKIWHEQTLSPPTKSQRVSIRNSAITA